MIQSAICYCDSCYQNNL